MADKKMIFMAEDDSFMVKIYAKVFTLEGFELKVAENGEVAINMLNSIPEKPSVFLLDVMMPNVDGFKLYEYIKSQEKYKNVPVVFLTNLYSPEDAEKAKNMGAKLYLVKSDNSSQDVVSTLKKLIGA